MSTMRVTNLKHENSASNNIVLNSDGSVGGDLATTLASKLPYSYGTATPSTSDDGFLWYDSNSTPPDVKFWDGAAFQALTSGKILQVVRATDGTTRSTTSTSFVDASISVTITPTKSTSAILLVWAAYLAHQVTANFARMQITDSSNNAISGAEGTEVGGSAVTVNVFVTQIGYATPATTSAVTYKGRFCVSSTGTAYLSNSTNTGQLFAIEVGA